MKIICFIRGLKLSYEIEAWVAYLVNMRQVVM